MKVRGWFQGKLKSLSYLHFFIGFLCCVTIYYAILGRYDTDEIEGLHTAWKISVGERIYEDFLQHHHPLFYYTLIPIIKLGGESVLSLYLAEVFAFAIFTTITIIAFCIARKIYDGKTALISIVLLLSFPFYIKKGTEIRPDTLQTLFGLASFYLLTIYMMDGGKRKFLVGSALLLALSFLALQKAIFLVSLIGVAQLYWLWKGEITKKDFLLYWSVFLILPAAYLVYLLTSGGFSNYFDFNWLVNMKLLDSFSPLENFSFEFLKSRFLATLITMGLFLLFVHGCFLKPRGFHGLVVFTGAGLLVSIFLVKLPYAQWFLPVAPLLSMVAAFAIRNLFTDSRIKIFLTVFVLLSTAYILIDTRNFHRKKDTISKIEYVISISNPEDRYFAVSGKGFKFNLFRKDVDFFWFCVNPGRCLETYQSFRDYDYDPVSLIEKNYPKVIFLPAVLDTYYPEMNNYEQSSEHKLFYIRKH